MDFKATLEYLYSMLPMYQRIGTAAFKKNLDNTYALCGYLGNPQSDFPSVHIAGTNGKGSSAHMLAAVLMSAGYRVGLYTSPHLNRFTERIRINGSEIAEEWVVDFVGRMKSQIESIKPSFFEFTVAMAFSYFSEQKVDIAVIETGLGGRLDSTNVITPLVSLITNISMDHADMLGDTLESIAFEKAGIIKSGRPVVLGEYQPDLLNVFAAIAGERRSSLCVAELEYPVNEYTLRSGMLFVKMSHGGQEFEIESSCTYQVRNLPGVIKTVELLRLEGFRIDNSALHSGLAAFQSLTGLRGRWQLVRRNPSVVLDVAHNEGGFSRILAELQTIQYERLFIVLGMVRDKDVAALVRMLPPEAHYFFVQAGIPRALGADELNQMATSAGRAGEAIPDVNEAIRRCIALAGRGDLILVTGSNFVVAEVEPEKW